MTAGGITLAFDIYGTLADTSGVARAVADCCGKDAKTAAAFAARWRDKQLEYTFRRTAMGYYADFGQCTAEALMFVCAEHGIKLDDSQRRELAAEYSRLPLFDDAKPALARLRQSGNVRMFAFSNGKADAVEKWMKRKPIGIAGFFDGIVSTDEIRMFKPSPQVYENFLYRAKAQAKDVHLVSGNPFDIIGARRAGMKALWLNRNNAPFDPWQGIAPSKTIASLTALADMFAPPKPETPPSPAKPNAPKTYQFNGRNYGGGRSPGLGRMVFDVIKHWADKNKPTSLKKLTAVFPQTLRGLSASAKDALFATKQEAEERYAEDKAHPRHVRSSNGLMTVRMGDGREYAVSNQWGEIDGAGDIRHFIAHAGKMGYGIKEVESAPAAQPVKIHVFIDMENAISKKEVVGLMAWLEKGGLPITAKAVTAQAQQFKAWDETLNQCNIKKIVTQNTGKDAADAALVGEIAVVAHTQKAGDIICIVGTDHIYEKAAEIALGRGFRVMRFGKAKPSWTTDNPNYRFFDINDTIAGKSQFPAEWKTRPSAKK